VPSKEYVILLPLTFNDGTRVGRDLILETRLELVAHFGGASFYPQVVSGYWVGASQTFEDKLIEVRVVGRGTEADEAFIRSFKEALKVRFDQEEIFIRSYSIELI
jgi:hypothetical protein